MCDRLRSIPWTRNLLAGLIAWASLGACAGLTACGAWNQNQRHAALQTSETAMTASHRFLLANGLTVLLLENHNRPLVTLDYWVRAGSADEPDHLNGISHFMEHMAFKGTDRYGPAEIDRMIESIGGVWNAATSRDYTHFYVNVASDHLTTAAEVLSQITQRAVIDSAEVDRERDVIIEEYRRKQDNPNALLYDCLLEAAYRAGPYKNSVLGTPETLRQIKAGDLLDYYHRHYGPANSLLVVAGAVTESELIPILEKTFGVDQRPWRPLLNKPTPAVFGYGVQRHLERDLSETYLGVALPAPAIDNREDIYAFDLLATVLGDGRSAWLHRKVKEEQGLVTSIGAHFGTHRYDGALLIIATLPPANRQAALNAIRECLAEMAIQINPVDLQRAKRIIRADYHYGMETNAGRAHTHAYYYTLTRSPEFLATYLEAMDRVQPEDLQRVALRYLNPENAAVVTIGPNGAPAARE